MRLARDTQHAPLGNGQVNAPDSHIEIAARSFGSFSEATHAVLDVLEARLTNVALFVVQTSDDGELVKIMAARGQLPLNRRTAAEMGVETAEVNDPILALVSAKRQFEIGSYVGIPLELKDGTRIATLAAISREPQRFELKDLKLLETMGRVIANELDRERIEGDLMRRERLLVESNQRLRAHATTDPITGVANRRSFDKALTDEWHLCRANGSSSYLMVVDLDEFKAVNDLFGHAVGDQALKDAAQALVTAGRQSDFVGRLGGDEFGVILVGCETPDTAAAYRERTRTAFAKAMQERQISLGFSAGFHSIADASSPTQALEMADQAMYWQKRQRAVRPDGGAGGGGLHVTPDEWPSGNPAQPKS